MLLNIFYLHLFLLSSTYFVNFTQSANILMITMGGTKSHKIPFWALAKALIARGHEITFLNGFEADFHIHGLHEVTPKRFVDFIQNYTNWDLVGKRYAGRMPLSLTDAMRYPTEACNSLLSDPLTMQHLLFARTTKRKGDDDVALQKKNEYNVRQQKYQLAILDAAYPECALGIVHRLNVTAFIYINTVAFYTGSISLAGNPIVYAVTPHVFTQTTQAELQLNFLQRVGNFVMHVAADLIHWHCMQGVHRVLRTHLDANMPHPYSLARNVAFILQNSHPAISYAHPYYPNVAEVACLHCRPAQPISYVDDSLQLAQFMDTAPAGVILFSLGTSVQSANMPAELRKLLLHVFKRLPEYHVLWKWEKDAHANSDLPTNVRLSAWLPQQDVLGHRNLKLFITHGGLLSMYEAVYHGVPLVMLPIFCDHDANAAKAAEDGYALKLTLANLTEDRLYAAIYDVLHNVRYRRAVSKRRRLLLDQLVQPLHQAVYWTEFVLRHKNATHLQAPARHMSYFAYHSLDVLSFLFTITLAWLIILRKIFYCCYCKNQKTATKNKQA